jgi:cyclopropane fatty-acyl-phospholipid synthase-like methyltransferase
MSQSVIASTSNRAAVAAVREYYDQCWDDYRVLWRTDENGSIHFGFVDRDEPHQSVVESLTTVFRACRGIVMAMLAGLAAATGTRRGRDSAVRFLCVAARGRASRHDRAQARMTETCARAVHLQRGERVLDAGCGVGGTDLWLAQHFAVDVVGLNIQPMHLRGAQRLAAGHPAGHRVRFAMQDYTEMAIADSRFNVVWALESVCHCADKMAFIREAYRVLEPGGRVMVADFFRADRTLEPDEAQRLKTWTDGWALPNLASVSEFRRGLESSGFHQIECRDIAANVMPSSQRLYRASLVARPINALLERLGWRSAAQGRNVRAAFEQYHTLQSRTWTYAIIVATK